MTTFDAFLKNHFIVGRSSLKMPILFWLSGLQCSKVYGIGKQINTVIHGAHL